MHYSGIFSPCLRFCPSSPVVHRENERGLLRARERARLRAAEAEAGGRRTPRWKRGRGGRQTIAGAGITGFGVRIFAVFFGQEICGEHAREKSLLEVRFQFIKHEIVRRFAAIHHCTHIDCAFLLPLPIHCQSGPPRQTPPLLLRRVHYVRGIGEEAPDIIVLSAQKGSLVTMRKLLFRTSSFHFESAKMGYHCIFSPSSLYLN